MSRDYGVGCLACGHRFDPVATRWRCPSCGFKANCCDGEPLQPAEPAAGDAE